jgi:outer membrane protein OmpA-like peptidoglycan-associated protein
MKKILPAALLLLIGMSSAAQTVQWATKVINFSSELTPIQYSAQQILGKPNVLPSGGQNPNAWTPNKPKRKEFITVGFDNPSQISQVAIAESHNPGGLYRVIAYDEVGGEHVIATLSPQSIPLKGRMLNVFTEKTAYKVTQIRLEFDGAAITDYFAIDAIGITDSRYPIIADIPKPMLLASGIVIEQLDENVNSNYDELNPLLSPDGKTLYFSRKYHPENVGGEKDPEDIWYSELDSTGHWQLAKNLRELNTAGPNFTNTITSVTPDGKSAIMILGNKYLDNGKMLAGVSISSNVGGKWSKPVAIEIENDYNFNEKANYFLTNNRQTLILSVEREDSEGDRDLYVSFMKADSSWTEPLNLGTVVNTAGTEQAPFLALDDKTLYFSSDGFSGYGRNDIYVTRRLDDTWQNWSEPENLGPEINSPLEDLFFNIPASSEFAYYSRGVTETNTDIFRVKLPFMRSPEPWVVVRGKIVDAATGQPLGAKIIYERLPDGKESGIAQSDPATGEYEVRLPGGNLYGIRAEAADKLSESQNLDLRTVKEDQTISGKDFTLEPIKVATLEEKVTITLNNVFFDFDKAELKPESYPELNRIVKLLNEKSTMEIEISGHTDNSGPDSYNLKLSERRAKAVAKYLEGQGIGNTRLKVEFHGETKPLESNETREGRKKNRRVEFKIVKM